MKRVLLLTPLLLFSLFIKAQTVGETTLDTTSNDFKGRVTFGGYIDTYYGYDFNKPESGDRPYFVSSARHNEFNINLVFIEIKYTASRLRARLAPGFGTYMNANYAAEPGVLKNIVEASIGIRLFKNKNIWLDAGIFGSPYTNESAISEDHLMYTRSFAPEYVPYYLSGIKVSMPINTKVTAYVYVLNGWQQIQDVNAGKSVGTQVEFRPNGHWLVNWNTYIGNETSDNAPQFHTRYFSDVFFIYGKNKFSATGCIYGGIQEIKNAGQVSHDYWWQANLIGKYAFTKEISLSGRVEYFDDPQSVQIVPITSVEGFSTYSTGLCLNFQFALNIMARVEARTFFSNQEVFLRNGNAVNSSNLIISSLAISF